MNGFNTTARKSLAVLLLASLAFVATPVARAAVEPGYEMGFRNITNLTRDLLIALDSDRRQQVPARVTLLHTVRLPCVASRPGAGGAASGEPVSVSAGFVDFINRVAHAKAIDEANRGFFVQYTTQIAQQSRATAVPDFNAAPSKDGWGFQTMNRQASHFNQMAGALLAIDLAHHYLGHYRKHAREFPAESALPMPVNAVVTEQEWRNAVLRGARNALDCGLGVDGLKAVFECFDQMPTRPAWAAYFIHPKANVTKINAELARLERDFFAMNETMRRSAPGGSGRLRR